MNDDYAVYYEMDVPHFTNRPQKNGSSVPFAWYLAVAILGVSCLLFLSTTVTLGFKVFQCQQQCLLENQKQENSSTVTNSVFTEKPLKTGGRRGTCKQKWTCCREKCYHFSHESKNFRDSRAFCNGMDSKLVKVEDEQQLNFIQSQITYYSWIGLSRQGTASLWTWEDNSQPLLEFDWEESSRGNCGSITASTMAAADCAKRMHVICEKRLSCLST